MLDLGRGPRLIYSCVISKLSYSLESLVLLQSDRQRLDSFYARCLRKIWNVRPAYFSRISNESIYGLSGARPLSDMILGRQLAFMGQVACHQDDCVLRQFVFQHGSISPHPPSGRRKRGRPRLQWLTSVLAFAEKLATEHNERLENVIGIDKDPKTWKAFVTANFST